MQKSLTSSSFADITSQTPCTGHCSTVLGDDVCRSCLRTFEEITRWIEMSDVERLGVNRRIALEKWEDSLEKQIL